MEGLAHTSSHDPLTRRPPPVSSHENTHFDRLPRCVRCGEGGFKLGEVVEYYSASQGAWIPAKVRSRARKRARRGYARIDLKVLRHVLPADRTLEVM